jgi:beta-glucanase (GH16 family)
MIYHFNYKRMWSKSVFFFIMIFILQSCTDDTQTVVNFDNLVLDEDFNTNGAPNASLWSYNIGTGQNGWGNNELQYYTDRPQNVTAQNGYLIITAHKESFNGSQYTSARLVTKGKFEQAYGRFETRMRLPWGQGIWPAFWMLGADIDDNPWPGAGEIDIMEFRGQNPSVVLGTVHGPGYSAGQFQKVIPYPMIGSIPTFMCLVLSGVPNTLTSMWMMYYTIKSRQPMCPVNGCLINPSIF